MLNYIPFFGWILDFLFKISLAIPFWFIYTVLGIGTKYFYFLPVVYQAINFWPTVGLFMVIGILKSVLLPTFSVNQTSK